MNIKKIVNLEQSLYGTLALLSYAYYVEGNGLIADRDFDVLERVYKKISGKEFFDLRGQELPGAYPANIVGGYERIKRG